MYFLGYVPDFNAVLNDFASSCSADVDRVVVGSLLELFTFEQHYLGIKLGERIIIKHTYYFLKPR